VLKEGAQESGLVLQRLTGTASGVGQSAQGGRRTVSQGVLLKITPGVFDGIEFGGVGGKIFQVEAELAIQEGFDFTGQMGTRAVPDDQEIASQLAEQLGEKAEGSIGVDVVVGMQAKVEVEGMATGRHHQRADTRHLLIGAAPLIEHGGVAAGSPGATHQRSHQKASFIEEHERRLQSAGFFLMRGQSFLIQRRMARASRSTARRSGFWGLHPRARNKRHTPEIS
jgi:hypothetical protein